MPGDGCAGSGHGQGGSAYRGITEPLFLASDWWQGSADGIGDGQDASFFAELGTYDDFRLPLQTEYTGANPNFRGISWWIRFFDYL